MGKLNPDLLRVAFLHFDPRYDDVAANARRIEALFRRAAALHADLVLTPELAVSGYEFHPILGHEWIRTDLPAILDRFCQLAAETRTALALGTPLYDPQTDRYANAAVWIAEDGRITGVHRKILVLSGKIEGWASPGAQAVPLEWRGDKIGLMVCADAASERLATELSRRGARVFINLASWAPGMHGPSGEWEQRSRETGLPVLVCNRTGQSVMLNFEGSSSVVATGGYRAAEYAETAPAILTLDFDRDWQPRGNFSTHPIISEE